MLDRCLLLEYPSLEYLKKVEMPNQSTLNPFQPQYLHPVLQLPIQVSHNIPIPTHHPSIPLHNGENRSPRRIRQSLSSPPKSQRTHRRSQTHPQQNRSIQQDPQLQAYRKHQSSQARPARGLATRANRPTTRCRRGGRHVRDHFREL